MHRFSRAFLIIAFLACLCNLSLQAQPYVYYVDYTTGNDGNSGLTEALAWKTVDKVNDSMASFANGDSVLFKRGEDWTGTGENLVITKTGLTSYLTFGAYGTGAKPKIWQATGAATAITCSTANVAYIHLDDIEAYSVKGVGTNNAIYFSADNLSHIWLSDILVSQSAQNGIFLQKIDTYILEDSTVHDCDQCNIVVYGSATYKITNGTISNCISYNAGTEDGLTIHNDDSSNSVGAHHVVQNCEVYDNYEDGFDFESGDDITVSGCYSHGNTGRAYSIGDVSSNIVVEKSWAVASAANSNLFVMDSGAHDATYQNCIGYYTGNQGALGVGTKNPSSYNLTWYNNTIILNSASAKLFSFPNKTLTNITVKNNIFVDLAATPVSIWVIFYSTTQNPTDIGCHWDYNWYYVPNVTEGSNARWYITKNTTAYNYANWKSTWSQDANSSADRITDPLLANGSGTWSLETDFQILTSSPCKDVGDATLGLAEDYFGNSRPIGAGPDIGAHEYQGGGGEPEINITDGTNTIGDGGTFDFGSKAVSSNTDQQFTLQNLGDANLTLSDPTIIYCTGFEYGLITTTTNAPSLLGALNGAPSIQGTVKRNGLYALEISPSAVAENVRMYFYTSPTNIVGKFYFRFGSFPAASIKIAYLYTVAGQSLLFWYDSASGKIQSDVNGGTRQDGPVLSLDTWYRVDFRADCATTTGTIDWRVAVGDEAGISYTQASNSITASTFQYLYMGHSAASTYAIYFDDFVLSATSGDYPIGPGGVVGLRPNADGTHNNAANIMEDSAGNDIDGTTYFAFDKLEEDPWTTTANADYVRQTATEITKYCEINFADTTETVIHGAFAILQFASSTAVADNGKIYIRDSDGQQTTLFDGDMSEITCFYKSSVVLTPSGGWTQAYVNSLKARFGYSSDADPDPYWLAMIIEVAYGPADIIKITGTNADQFSVQAQPSTPVAGPGSTTFTLRFSPTSSGVKVAAIAIVNNDADENPYNIALTGTAGEPEINITDGEDSIADGGTFDFWFHNIGTNTDQIFTLENLGSVDLTLNGSPIITITGADAGQFSVQSQPTTPIAAAGHVHFTLRFSPTSPGAKTAAIAIANNDTDENPYNITLTGSGWEEEETVILKVILTVVIKTIKKAIKK